MIHACERAGLRWSLDYAVRSRGRAAWIGLLSAFGPRVRFHVDDESGRTEAAALLHEIDTDEHIYCCGPTAMMDAVALAAEASGITPERAHFERFAPSDAKAASEAVPASFAVVLAHSGKRCIVEAGESILECLERHGVTLPHSCREGLCGSCGVPLISGEAEHLDYVLDDTERAANRRLMICVSRSRSPELVLGV